MALSKKKFSEIPSDAVVLSESDAFQYQMDIITKWKKDRDTWIFRYGYGIMASMTAISAMFINNHYRVKLKLREFGRMSSYLPVVVIPSLVSGVFHQQFIVKDVLIQKTCPTCIELRSASLQSVLSTIFPAVIAPLAALPFAIRYNTYNVPVITKEPMQVANMLYRHTKPIANVLIGIMAAQAVMAALVTYYEQLSIGKIHRKLNELEDLLEKQYGNVS